MSAFNKLAARKELGAILHRLDETGLHTNILRRIVGRHIENLNETLPTIEFYATLIVLRDALTMEKWGEIRTAANLLLDAIPTTYGSIPAGSAFHLPNSHSVCVKRKGGFQLGLADLPHLPADQVVILENI